MATALPALAAALSVTAFMSALLIARWRRPAEPGATRTRRSIAGIALQGAAAALICSGPVRVALDPLSAAALLLAVAVLASGLGATALFAWSVATWGGAGASPRAAAPIAGWRPPAPSRTSATRSTSPSY